LIVVETKDKSTKPINSKQFAAVPVITKLSKSPKSTTGPKHSKDPKVPNNINEGSKDFKSTKGPKSSKAPKEPKTPKAPKSFPGARLNVVETKDKRTKPTNLKILEQKKLNEVIDYSKTKEKESNIFIDNKQMKGIKSYVVVDNQEMKGEESNFVIPRIKVKESNVVTHIPTIKGKESNVVANNSEVAPSEIYGKKSLCKKTKPIIKKLVASEYAPAMNFIVENDVMNLCPGKDASTDLQIQQRFYLATIYFKTNGPEWRVSRESSPSKFRNGVRWLSESSECRWDGITCTNDVVTKINLSSKYLFGVLPSEFSAFPLLTELDLYSNSLNGKIPEAFEKLTKLVSLDMGTNQLAGSIPNIFRNMQSLQSVYLESNFFTGDLPASLCANIDSNPQFVIGVDCNNNKVNCAACAKYEYSGYISNAISESSSGEERRFCLSDILPVLGAFLSVYLI